jgi:hypothetical protein
MPNENRKQCDTHGGQKSMHLREMVEIKVKTNKPFTNKTSATNRQQPRKRK